MTISKMQAAAAAAVPSADDAYAEPLFQRKGRKWSKPKDKPKHPLSAYNMFFQCERARLQAEAAAANAAKAAGPNPNGFIDLARGIATRWKRIDPACKALFEERARLDQCRYRIELAAWKVAKGMVPDSTPSPKTSGSSSPPRFDYSQQRKQHDVSVPCDDWASRSYPGGASISRQRDYFASASPTNSTSRLDETANASVAFYGSATSHSHIPAMSEQFAMRAARRVEAPTAAAAPSWNMAERAAAATKVVLEEQARMEQIKSRMQLDWQRSRQVVATVQPSASTLAPPQLLSKRSLTTADTPPSQRPQSSLPVPTQACPRTTALPPATHHPSPMDILATAAVRKLSQKDPPNMPIATSSRTATSSSSSPALAERHELHSSPTTQWHCTNMAATAATVPQETLDGKIVARQQQRQPHELYDNASQTMSLEAFVAMASRRCNDVPGPKPYMTVQKPHSPGTIASPCQNDRTSDIPRQRYYEQLPAKSGGTVADEKVVRRSLNGLPNPAAAPAANNNEHKCAAVPTVPVREPRAKKGTPTKKQRLSLAALAKKAQKEQQRYRCALLERRQQRKQKQAAASALEASTTKAAAAPAVTAVAALPPAIVVANRNNESIHAAFPTDARSAATSRAQLLTGSSNHDGRTPTLAMERVAALAAAGRFDNGPQNDRFPDRSTNLTVPSPLDPRIAAWNADNSTSADWLATAKTIYFLLSATSGNSTAPSASSSSSSSSSQGLRRMDNDVAHASTCPIADYLRQNQELQRHHRQFHPCPPR